MLPISPPDQDPIGVYDACVRGFADYNERKASLKGARAAIGAQIDLYGDYAAAYLYKCRRSEVDFAGVPVKHFQDLYNQKFVPTGAPGRDLYLRILGSGAGGRCGLCHAQTAGTVDHFLPKASYPAFAVHPLNLIPACERCNRTKWEHCPTEQSEVFIHPYFDDVTNEHWLQARLLKPDAGVIPEYRVHPDANLEEALRDRLEFHLDRLKLATMYGVLAAHELADMRYVFEVSHASDGAEAIRQLADLRASSAARVNPNSWQAALYRAIRDSNWFCEDGWSQIGH